jgi:hypothetical protein
MIEPNGNTHDMVEIPKEVYLQLVWSQNKLEEIDRTIKKMKLVLAFLVVILNFLSPFLRLLF